MKKVTFTLNGEKMAIAAGSTILEAAASRGVFIPTFCHLKELKPMASCYVCVVEVDGQEDLAPACSTEVTAGMVITTDNPRVREARHTCVELLLSDHVGDCVGPCMDACPAGIDIPGFINHLAKGENHKALALIKRNMPLPGCLGRICKRPCEDACRRQLVEEQIGICHLKRFADDAVADAGDEYIPRKGRATGKRVAIVGAGPAGLTAAYYLQILGHDCTVFDAHKRAGGMLRHGIPRFRLPGGVIDREVAVIRKLGAKFKYNTRLGEKITLDELRDEYDAVFLALGAQRAMSLGVEGEDSKGIFSGLAFLHENNVSAYKKPSVGKKVIVIGGGDVAMDTARVARRRGASVRIYCLEKQKEMPAGAAEIEAVLDEGISIYDRFGVKQIIAEGGRVKGVEFRRCTRVFDKDGAFSPRYKESDTTIDKCTTLVVAIGQAVDTQMAEGIDKTGMGLITAADQTMQTSMDNVFAGGDCVSGPNNAVNAVAAGTRAAISIDQFVLGQKVVGDRGTYKHSMGPLAAVPKAVTKRFETADRAPMPQLAKRTRIKNFNEVEQGFTQKMVVAEAERCMECGCRDAHECKLRTYATLFEADVDRFKGDKREYDLDDSHPDIVYQAHKCIQCRTCVRITEELLGTGSLTIVGRGFTTRVKPKAGGKLKLVKDKGLKKIVEGCPVGALTLKTDPVQTLDPVFKPPGVPC